MKALLTVLAIVLVPGGLILAVLSVFNKRRHLSDAWMVDHDRRVWREGNPDQICWSWPISKIENETVGR